MRRNDFFKSLLFGGGNPASRVELETETLPYTFNSNSYKLRNYRIYGNTVNEESVGDLVTEGEHVGQYCVPLTITNGTDTKTTNIYLPEQIRKVGDETEYIDYKKQKQHKVRKNLFDFSSWADSLVYTTRISYNITGNIITLNATSNDAFTSPYSHATGGFEIPVNPNTTYILSWQSDNNNSGQVYVFENGVLSGNQMHNVDNSSQKSMRFTTLPNTRFLTFRLGVSNIGDSIAYFNIQLELGSVITPYEPYIQNTELDVTLPTLPTTAGTNTLSVGTTVQPSKVYLQGKISEAEIVSAEPVQTNVQSLQPLSLDDDDFQLDVMPTESDLQLDVMPSDDLQLDIMPIESDLQLDVIIPTANLNRIEDDENAE